MNRFEAANVTRATGTSRKKFCDEMSLSVPTFGKELREPSSSEKSEPMRSEVPPGTSQDELGGTSIET